MSDIDLKDVIRTLDQYGSTFDKHNDTPNTAVSKTVGDGVGAPQVRKVLSPEDQFVMKRQLMKLSDSELSHLFTLQLQKDNTGIPLSTWLAAGSRDHSTQLVNAMSAHPTISKALDLGGGTALIRQDLEPILYPLFVRNFPAWDRFSKTPANGQVHTWNQITAYGDAQFMTELGTVTDDTATYVRQTSNIAVLATRRGTSLKNQLSILAGGMNWDAERLEIQQGLVAMANKMQKTIFQGQASNSGGTASNELGAYDANGFTGLRSTLNTARAVNFQPYLTSNPDSFAEAIGEATVPITDNGGRPNVVYMRAAEQQKLNAQQIEFQRFVNQTEVTPGLTVPTVATPVGLLPVVGVPGDSIGHYTATTFDSNDVADVYVLDDSTITIPYLGSPGPTVLDIPMGVSGQLTHLYIIWLMAGLAPLSIVWSNKCRADLGTS